MNHPSFTSISTWFSRWLQRDGKADEQKITKNGLDIPGKAAYHGNQQMTFAIGKAFLKPRGTDETRSMGECRYL